MFAPFANSTIHGLSDIAQSEYRRLKIFWIVTLSVCLTLFAYNAYQMIHQFRTDNIATKISIVRPPTFPTVTVCPRHWVDPLKAEQYNITEDDYAFILSHLESVSSQQTEVIARKRDEIAGGNRTEQEASRKLRKILEDNSFTFEGFLRDISLPWKQVIPKTLTHFLHGNLVRNHLTTAGMCYLYNDTEPYNEFNYEDLNIAWECVPKYFQLEPDLDRVFFGEDGASLAPHNRIEMKPGISMRIDLHASHFVRLDRKQNCKKYSTEDRVKCVAMCTNEICDLVHNCSGFWPQANQASVCADMLPSTACTALTTGMNTTGMRIVDECIQTNCLFPCSSWEYSAAISPNHNKHKFGELVTHIWLKFANPRGITKVREYEEMTIFSLCSSLGGGLSLFCGASLLSIIQLFVILCVKKRDVDRVEPEKSMYA